MPKEITTINCESSLLEAVRRSGVRNMSRYVEGLMRADLKGVQKVRNVEEKRVAALREKLADIDRRWLEDRKRGRV